MLTILSSIVSTIGGHLYIAFNEYKNLNFDTVYHFHMSLKIEENGYEHDWDLIIHSH